MSAPSRDEHSMIGVLVDPDRRDSVVLEEFCLEIGVEVEALRVDGIDLEFELLRESRRMKRSVLGAGRNDAKMETETRRARTNFSLRKERILFES